MAGFLIGERTANSSHRIPIQWASSPADRPVVGTQPGAA